MPVAVLVQLRHFYKDHHHHHNHHHHHHHHHHYCSLYLRNDQKIWITTKIHIFTKGFKHIECGRFLAATKQLNEWYFPSVCLSVRPSVCLSVTPFWLCSHHQIIMTFSRVITNDKSDVHAKGQGQRSKVKVTEVMTPFSRFRTVTPFWIHILRWNYAYSLMLLRRGALLFFKVIRQISRSHGSKNRRIWPNLAFPDCNSSLNSPMGTKWCTKLEVAWKRCPIVFEGHP